MVTTTNITFVAHPVSMAVFMVFLTLLLVYYVAKFVLSLVTGG